MILVDTDVLIEILDKESEHGDGLLKRIVDSGEDFAITSITLHEILYGLVKYGKSGNKIIDIPVVGFEKEEAILSAKLEYSAERGGVKIDREDAMIAAIAINNNSRLYTLNKKHFKVLERFGLKLFE